MHEKFWVGQSCQSSSENTGSLCTAVWLLSFVLLSLLLLTSALTFAFQTLVSLSTELGVKTIAVLNSL